MFLVYFWHEIRLWKHLKYTPVKNMHRPCMVNRIWGRTQHSLHENRHASFHFHGLCRDDSNGKQAKISNGNICLHRELNKWSLSFQLVLKTTGPAVSYRVLTLSRNSIKINTRSNTCINFIRCEMCIGNDCQPKSAFLLTDVEVIYYNLPNFA